MATVTFLFNLFDYFIIFLAAIFIIALIIIGVVFFTLRKVNKSRASYRELAQKLNLQLPNPKKLELLGNYNNCDVRLAVRVERSTGSDHRSTEYFTYCRTGFPHSLRLLLNISSPKGLLSNIFKTNPILLGQPNFDQNFNVKCYDREILQKMLLTDFHSNKTQNLMGDLMLVKQDIPKINVTDDNITLELSGMINDAEKLKQMLDLTTYLANRFQTVREKLPLTVWEKQLINNWQKLANENGLIFNSKTFQIQGNYKSFPVLVEVITLSGKWQTRIKLRFPQSLMIGLQIMRENSVHKAFTWLGVQDIEAGIKEFDDTFIVKGKNIAVAKYKLQPDFCNQLIRLNRQASNLKIDDNEFFILFDKILGDEPMLKSYIEATISTAKMLTR